MLLYVQRRNGIVHGNTLTAAVVVENIGRATAINDATDDAVVTADDANVTDADSDVTDATDADSDATDATDADSDATDDDDADATAIGKRHRIFLTGATFKVSVLKFHEPWGFKYGVVNEYAGQSMPTAMRGRRGVLCQPCLTQP